MRIALDTMGGDAGPRVVCEAALDFLFSEPSNDLRMILVGPEEEIFRTIEEFDETPGGRLAVIDTGEFISPEDEAVRAIRNKKDSSMVRCLRMVRDGEADAMVSPGNTGALVAGGVLITGRIPGVERPALASEMPSVRGDTTLILDLGASVDVRPRHLYYHAIMGMTYARMVMNRPSPSFGLLNIGTEDVKGDQLRRDTYPLLENLCRSDANCTFVGNVEARDLMQTPVDVVITDGFVGNMVLKAAEGMERALIEMLRNGINSSLGTRLGGLLLQSTLRSKLKEFDYRKKGGAVLLGVKGMVIKCHGASGREAIVSAIRQALKAANKGVPALIASSLEERAESSGNE